MLLCDSVNPEWQCRHCLGSRWIPLEKLPLAQTLVSEGPRLLMLEPLHCSVFHCKGSLDNPKEPFAVAFDDAQYIVEKRFFWPFWKLTAPFSATNRRLKQQVEVLHNRCYEVQPRPPACVHPFPLSTLRSTRSFASAAPVRAKAAGTMCWKSSWRRRSKPSPVICVSVTGACGACNC